MVEPMDLNWALITKRDYVCSNCWGHLIDWPDEEQPGHLWVLLCHRCGIETVGYVTRFYVENRRSESIGEKMETREMLEELGILPKQAGGRTESEILEEIGF